MASNLATFHSETVALICFLISPEKVSTDTVRPLTPVNMCCKDNLFKKSKQMKPLQRFFKKFSVSYKTIKWPVMTVMQ